MNVEELIQSYTKGASLESLARRYHTHYIKIKNILRENNIRLKTVQKSIIPDNIDEILQLYNSGMNSNQIAKKFKISGQNLRKFIRRHINLRKREEYCKQYPINIEPFKDPSTEEASYWLGFIMADGHVRKYPKTSSVKVVLKLQAKDIGHLWKFAKDLSTTKQPKFVNSTTPTGEPNKSAYLCICNQELYELLISYGVKDFKGKGIINLPKNLNMQHWLRGLIDGDGIISTSNHGKYLRLGFISPHKNICEYVQKQLCKFTSCKRLNKITARISQIATKPVYVFNWTGSPAVEIARYLYCNSTRYLQRKLDKVRPFIYGDKHEQQSDSKG
jgi:Mor family transcriptional regulator